MVWILVPAQTFTSCERLKNPTWPTWKLRPTSSQPSQLAGMCVPQSRISHGLTEKVEFDEFAQEYVEGSGSKTSATRQPFSPLPQQNKDHEREPVWTLCTLKCRDCPLRVRNQCLGVRKTISRVWIVIGTMALFLHPNEGVGEIDDLRGKAQTTHLHAGVLGKAMRQGAIDLGPGRISSYLTDSD